MPWVEATKMRAKDSKSSPPGDTCTRECGRGRVWRWRFLAFVLKDIQQAPPLQPALQD